MARAASKAYALRADLPGPGPTLFLTSTQETNKRWHAQLCITISHCSVLLTQSHN